jgi:hypothetical protein
LRFDRTDRGAKRHGDGLPSAVAGQAGPHVQYRRRACRPDRAIALCGGWGQDAQDKV